MKTEQEIKNRIKSLEEDKNHFEQNNCINPHDNFDNYAIVSTIENNIVLLQWVLEFHEL